MKIAKLSWTDYRSLTDDEIVTNGRNVVISGRNGEGKSSIASMLPFVLFGKVSAKAFDDKGISIDAQNPAVTIEFDNGLTLRREVGASNKNRTFINGKEVSASKFNVQIANLTGSAGNLLFSPFEFPNLHWKEQREFLIANFTDIQDLPSPDEKSSQVRKLKTQRATLEGRISEVKQQALNLPKSDAAQLQTAIEAREAEASYLRSRLEMANTDTSPVQNLIDNSARQLRIAESRLSSANRCLQELRRKYSAVKQTCPTCGQHLPTEAVTKARSEIVALGQRTRNEVTALEAEVREVSAQLEGYRQQLSDLNRKKESRRDNTTVPRLERLAKEITALKDELIRVNLAEDLRERYRQLVDEETQLNLLIHDTENEIAQIEYKRQSAIKRSEELINGHFQFVKFKIYKQLASGEVRETCEAMIDGVPYSSLSKGERFCAACDILRALQERFELEMPLMIDDAESYTPNSQIQLPNQLFIFRVMDCDLTIDVQ